MLMRYTCLQCGIVTRVLEGQDHVACACQAGYDEVREDETPYQSPKPAE